MIEKNKLLLAIQEYVKASPGNRLPDGEFIYEVPLVGFVDAHDPLFMEMKSEKIIGPMFKLPGEWLNNAASIISYFLPFSYAVRSSNYEDAIPSDNWMHGRFAGEIFNDQLRKYINRTIQEMGGKGVAPVLEPSFSYDPIQGLSNWSERHIAYAAGLGSFGLSRGLITSKGLSGRFGSIITDLNFAPAILPREKHNANCPYFDNLDCGACIKRCPAGAISKSGMDKAACKAYITSLDQHTEKIRAEFGYTYSACGKCMSNVPCEDKTPGL